MIIIVFDWDDTLVPSAQLNKLIDDPEGKDEVENIRSNILTLFSLAQSCSDRFIILTNASQSWVDQCAHKLNIDIAKIEVYSNQRYKHLVDDSLHKQVGLLDNFIHIFDDRQTHTLISFGDTDWDRQASLFVKNNFPNVIVKHVQFVYEPTVRQLILQQRLIISQWSNIVSEKGHLDISMKACDTEAVIVYN